MTAQNRIHNARPECFAREVLLDLHCTREQANEWPLVVLGPGGDYSRRYVAREGRIQRESPSGVALAALGAQAEARSLASGAPALGAGFSALRARFADILASACTRFEEVAIEIFSTRDSTQVTHDSDAELEACGDHAAAAQAFTAQLADAPQGAFAPDGQAMLGGSLLALVRAAEAEQAFAKALDDSSSLSSAARRDATFIRAAEATAAQEKWAESLAIAEKFLAVAPQVPQGRYAAAWLWPRTDGLVTCGQAARLAAHARGGAAGHTRIQPLLLQVAAGAAQRHVPLLPRQQRRRTGT
jgi:tetratricopeptide (TPR) repeat protein